MSAAQLIGMSIRQENNATTRLSPNARVDAQMHRPVIAKVLLPAVAVALLLVLTRSAAVSLVSLHMAQVR